MRYSPFYRIVSGADTAVLFVHGIVGTPAHFRELIPLVPEGWTVYNILLEGHGGSVEDFAAASMAGWKAQVHRALEELRAAHESVYLVAHSMGTLLCIQECLADSRNVRGLFLLNVPLHPWVRPSSVPQTLAAIRGKTRPDSMGEMLLQDCGVHLSPCLFQYLTWIPRYWELLRECAATRSLVRQIRLPCVCFQSARDELVRRRSFRFLAGCGNLTVTELPSSGHYGYAPKDLENIRRAFSSFLHSPPECGAGGL